MSSPLLFSERTPADADTARQYAGTDSEPDIKRAPLLFGKKVRTGPETAEQFHGTDTELDQKDASVRKDVE